MPDLKELLGEELYGQVTEKVGDEHKIAVVSDGSYIPKDKFNDKNDEVKSLKSQLEERDNQLEELSGKVKGNEELENQIELLKEQNKQATEALQKELDQKTFDFNLEKSLLSKKARNPKAVRALLDTEAIKLNEEGKLVGLEEQLSNLQESDPYLFDIEPESDPKPAGRYSPGSLQKNNRNSKDVDPRKLGAAKAAERHKKEDDKE